MILKFIISHAFYITYKTVLQMLLQEFESPFSSADLPISLFDLNLVTSEKPSPCLHLPTVSTERTS